MVSCKNFSREELKKCLSRPSRWHASIKTWVQPQHPIGSLGVSACTHSPCAWRQEHPRVASWSVSLNYWAPGSVRNPVSKSKVESRCEAPRHWPLASKGTQELHLHTWFLGVDGSRTGSLRSLVYRTLWTPRLMSRATPVFTASEQSTPVHGPHLTLCWKGNLKWSKILSIASTSQGLCCDSHAMSRIQQRTPSHTHSWRGGISSEFSSRQLD